MTRRILAAAVAVVCALPLLAEYSGHGNGTSRRLGFLTGYLSLTDTQKTQAKAIFDAAEAASQTAIGQLTSARDALKTAVKANPSDGELDRLAAAVGLVQGQMQAIQAKAEAKFYALLTAEQKTKYDARGSRGTGGPRFR